MKINPHWLSWPETQELIKAFNGEHDRLRFVGGAVRDSLLGMEANDVDAATSCPPEKTLELLEHAGIRAIPTGIKHGTVTAVIGAKHFEITTLRRDTACDGRHAEVVYTDSWQEDAARRDFTMNALYMDTNGEMFDYFGGIEDAKAGHVKFIGDASRRISEDYLRILRFFRFYAWYGKEEPDKAALSAARQEAAHIDSLSGERIQHEMLRLFSAPQALATLVLMQETGVLTQVCGFNTNLNHPALSFSREDPGSMQNGGMTILVLILLLADIPPPEALDRIVKRWHLSNEIKKYLSVLVINLGTISPDLSGAKLKQIIRKLGVKIFASLVLLKQTLEPNEAYIKMLEFAESWQVPVMPVRKPSPTK